MTGTRTKGYTTSGALLFLMAGLGLQYQAAAQEEYRLQGDEVAIYNLLGDVEMARGAGDEVIIQMTRGGGDAEQLGTDFRNVQSRASFIVEYPDGDLVYPRMGKRFKTHYKGALGDLGKIDFELRGSGKGLEAWADLKILVPPGKDLALYQVAGDITLLDVEGNLQVSTRWGSVQAEGGQGDLEVDTGSGAVALTGFDGGVVADTGSGAVTMSDIRGDEITADTGSGGVTLSRIRGGEVTVDTGSGNVELSDIEGDDLEVDTGSGSVKLSHIEGDEITVDTGSGSVWGAGVIGESLTVDTGSGKIELKGVASPEVQLDTGNGAVEVELVEDVESLEADTGSGRVTLKLPASIGAQLELDTGSGGIEVDVPVQVRKSEKDYLLGILGDGEGSITVDTGSGKIRVIGE